MGRDGEGLAEGRARPGHAEPDEERGRRPRAPRGSGTSAAPAHPAISPDLPRRRERLLAIVRRHLRRLGAAIELRRRGALVVDARDGDGRERQRREGREGERGEAAPPLHRGREAERGRHEGARDDGAVAGELGCGHGWGRAGVPTAREGAYFTPAAWHVKRTAVVPGDSPGGPSAGRSDGRASARAQACAETDGEGDGLRCVSAAAAAALTGPPHPQARRSPPAHVGQAPTAAPRRAAARPAAHSRGRTAAAESAARASSCVPSAKKVKPSKGQPGCACSCRRHEARRAAPRSPGRRPSRTSRAEPAVAARAPHDDARRA